MSEVYTLALWVLVAMLTGLVGSLTLMICGLLASITAMAVNQVSVYRDTLHKIKLAAVILVDILFGTFIVVTVYQIIMNLAGL